MHRFRKILAGVELADDRYLVSPDGLRPRCADALAKATWLAEQSGAELRIVHSLAVGPRSLDLMLRDDATGAPSPIGDATNVLDALAADARERGLQTSHKLLHGDPVTALKDEARDWEADLIVVAGRDRTRLVGLLGSTAAQLFRSANVPVWIARRGVRQAMRVVLAAATLDAHSHGVLRLAADTARRMGARLHVLHVQEKGDPVRATLARTSLEAWVRAHASDVPLDGVEVLHGRPSDVIVRRAAETGADAVFIGPSRRGALTARITARPTEPLLRRLHCSLICARAVPGSSAWPTTEAAPAGAAAG